jgi:peptide-methionine (S)-S-oxide reductase
MKSEKAIFGGGCFWCTEAVYNELEGVIKVEPGYSGGNDANPTYEDVCSGETGHAEVVQIEYNPDIISFEQLLEVFFKTHNPTTLNRQGADIGTQYRSIILYTNEEQKQIATNYIKRLTDKKEYSAPIVTEIKPLEHFYLAEKYHQNYYLQNLFQPYCRMVIQPKVKKVKTEFQPLLKKK